MNRIILGIITITAALGVAAFTTFATWSDTVTVSNNQIQTGTADLQVSSVGTNGPWNTSTNTSTLNLSGLVPGGAVQDGFSFALKNNSSDGVNFNISAQVTAVIISGDGSPDQSKLLIAVYPDGATPETGSDWKSLTDWQSGSLALNNTVNASGTKSFNIAAKLLSSAGNEWQGRMVTFTLTVNGQQP